MLITLSENVKSIGRVKITACNPRNAEKEMRDVLAFLDHFPFEAYKEPQLNAHRSKRLKELLDAYHRKATDKETYLRKNTVVTAGRTLLANSLWQTAIDTRVNYVALGTGTNAPANGDTTLQTETFRKVLASGNHSSNIVTLTGFFTAAETSGTFREAGLFINGTASADTGTLLSRVAINITKSVLQTLTIEWTITIS